MREKKRRIGEAARLIKQRRDRGVHALPMHLGRTRHPTLAPPSSPPPEHTPPRPDRHATVVHKQEVKTGQLYVQRAAATKN